MYSTQCHCLKKVGNRKVRGQRPEVQGEGQKARTEKGTTEKGRMMKGLDYFRLTCLTQAVMLVCMCVHLVESVTLICALSPRVCVQEFVVFCFIDNNGI